MNTKLEVHIICYNEVEILRYALRHYLQYASRIYVHDSGSTDGSQALATSMGAQVVPFDTDGKLNDLMHKELKERAWRGTDADWVIVVDADELLYWPSGYLATIEAYNTSKMAVIHPYGYELTSLVYPTTEGQIYDEVKYAAPDNYWYGKPVMFAPSRIRDIQFSAGAHTCRFWPAGQFNPDYYEVVTPDTPFASPETWLLHCKHLGPVERIGERYNASRRNFSQINLEKGWGHPEDGLSHAIAKRQGILANLRKLPI